MIRCPNHGWRFGPDGRCNQIPYSTMPLPQTLGIKAWHLEERAGCIFDWHDPEGGDPTYDLPLFQEWDDPRWIRWPIDELEELDRTRVGWGKSVSVRVYLGGRSLHKEKSKTKYT